MSKKARLLIMILVLVIMTGGAIFIVVQLQESQAPEDSSAQVLEGGGDDPDPCPNGGFVVYPESRCCAGGGSCACQGDNYTSSNKGQAVGYFSGNVCCECTYNPPPTPVPTPTPSSGGGGGSWECATAGAPEGCQRITQRNKSLDVLATCRATANSSGRTIKCMEACEAVTNGTKYYVKINSIPSACNCPNLSPPSGGGCATGTCSGCGNAYAVCSPETVTTPETPTGGGGGGGTTPPGSTPTPTPTPTPITVSNFVVEGEVYCEEDGVKYPINGAKLTVLNAAKNEYMHPVTVKGKYTLTSTRSHHAIILNKSNLPSGGIINSTGQPYSEMIGPEAVNCGPGVCENTPNCTVSNAYHSCVLTSNVTTIDFKFTNCVQDARCGDGSVDPGEQCDPLAEPTGCGVGEICQNDCTCSSPPADCPNGTVDAGEECDPDATPDGCDLGETCLNDCTCLSTAGCGEGCTDDTNCPDDQVCDSSICKLPICLTPGNCSDDMCDPISCGEECSPTGQCPEGHACSEGVCILEECVGNICDNSGCGPVSYIEDLPSTALINDQADKILLGILVILIAVLAVKLDVQVKFIEKFETRFGKIYMISDRFAINKKGQKEEFEKKINSRDNK